MATHTASNSGSVGLRLLRGEAPDTIPTRGVDLRRGDEVLLDGRRQTITVVAVNAKHTYVEFKDTDPGEWDTDHTFLLVS